jgi:5-methyltetrahydrofolate--homocysteine methyltransferase
MPDYKTKPEHNAAIGSVEGDLHDTGKNLVAMMCKGANIEVIDLGVDVPPVKFVEAIKQRNPKLVGLSALLTTTMPARRDTVKAIRAAGLTVNLFAAHLHGVFTPCIFPRPKVII